MSCDLSNRRGNVTLLLVAHVVLCLLGTDPCLLSWADILWAQNPTHFFISSLIASSSSYGRSVIWWQLHAYLMLHSSFQSLIRNHFGMTEGMWYVICRVYLQPPINLPETNKLFFDISNFSDVFDEEHFINSLANDVKVEKKLPKELVKAPKSVRYFKSWSGVDYYQDEISPLWDHRQVWF